MSAIPRETLLQTLAHFRLRGSAVSCACYGGGHINTTRLVSDSTGKRYILQRINTRAFADVPALMENIHLVTDHLRRRIRDERGVLTPVSTDDGRYYVKNAYGFWRVYEFVEGSVCLQRPRTSRDLYESAVAFGRFQQALQDFPAGKLHETIPHFHDTPERCRQLQRSIARDSLGRAGAVQREIDFLLQREEAMGAAQRMLWQGALPLRVTHNDTKLNNVLLDAQTHRALCVIDLDTVMPGLSIFDFGDCVRFGAATAAEDTRELEQMGVDPSLFRACTQGFLHACPGLTANELDALVLGGRLMTLECGMRFLTDYLDGDHYFAIQYPEHNLDRARAQLKLAFDMERREDELRSIIKEEQP